MRLGILTSHPIQYQAPWFRALAGVVELEVFFAHRQTAAHQARAGFGVAFEWDVDLLSGYHSTFLKNVARHPSVDHFWGCDTPELRERIVAGGYDAFVVTGWYLKTFLQAVRFCRQTRTPVLVRGDSQLQTPRSAAKRLLKTVIHRALLRQFDGFLTVGQRNTEYLRHYGAPGGRIFSTPHFVDNEWFARRARSARADRARVREQWSAPDGRMVALFVGKFVAKKRPLDMVRALAAMCAPGQAPVAVFVGAGPLDEILRTEAASLGVAAHFEGFKNQTELPRYYAAADVLVLPSEGGETWGLVVNEAMACGLPAVVAESVGCAPDLVIEGQTGFTFPLGEVAQLAERLCRISELLRSGHDFAPALGAKLRDYSAETATAGTIRALETLAPTFRR